LAQHDAVSRPLGGHVALVTGSSRNIGRAIVLGLADRGADVIVNARTSRDEADSVVAEARAHGVQAAHLLADVRDQRAMCDGLETIQSDLGTVDVLVNCAAVRPETAFETMFLEEWREVISIMLDGAFVATQAVIGGMLERGWGRIINIIGITGQAGAPQRAHVVAGKAGLIGFTKALALEYGSRGITVNAVSPGLIDTTRGGTSSVLQPAHHEDRRIAVGHYGQPDDVASICCYLASDEARFVTGQVLSVNGGAYM
jgi:3-oxoacyl-[acyl-carrier protein] reductase